MGYGDSDYKQWGIKRESAIMQSIIDDKPAFISMIEPVPHVWPTMAHYDFRVIFDSEAEMKVETKTSYKEKTITISRETSQADVFLIERKSMPQIYLLTTRDEVYKHIKPSRFNGGYYVYLKDISIEKAIDWSNPKDQDELYAYFRKFASKS